MSAATHLSAATPPPSEQPHPQKVDVEFDGASGRVDGADAPGAPPRERLEAGHAAVTSRRLLWLDAAAAPAPGRSFALPLAALAGAEKRTQRGLNPLAPPKVRLELRVTVSAADGIPCAPHEAAAAGGVALRRLALRCRGAAPDAFLQQLTAAAAAHRAWLAQQPPAQPQVLSSSAAAGFSQQLGAPAAGGASADWGGGGGGGSGVGAVGGGGGGGGGGARALSAADVDASYLRAIVDMVRRLPHPPSYRLVAWLVAVLLRPAVRG